VLSLAMSLELAASGGIASSAQTAPSSTPPDDRATMRESVIHGTVKIGTLPLQSVRVTASDARTGKQATTATDGNGAYTLTLPSGERFLIRAERFGYAPSSTEVLLNIGTKQVDFSLKSGGDNLSSLWEAALLPPVTSSSVSLQPAFSTIGASSGAQIPSFPGDPNFSGDSFTVDGQASIVNPFFQMDDLMRQSFEDGHQLQATSVGSDEDLSTAGPVTPSSPNQIHGLAFWNGGNSALNANPFLLAGQASPNPRYDSNGYGLVITGHPFLPGITRPGDKDSVSLSFAGQIATTLVNDYATVPTGLERAGNFSQLRGPTGGPVPIYPPGQSAPYPNNTIDRPLDPVALALLEYLPRANLNSTGLNYRLITPQGTHTNTIGAGYTHSFAASAPAFSNNSQSLSVNFNLNRVANDVINVFPAFGGKRVVQGYALTAAYAVNKTHLFSNFSVTSNRNNAGLRNHYTNVEDVATEAGVLLEEGFDRRLNTNPLNYGLPNLVLNNFTSLSQTQPNYQLTQAIGISASSSWEHGTHIVRFGGDVRRIEFNLFGGTNATGTFIFTGAYTQQPGVTATNPVAVTGSSFADFLLGLPHETNIESAHRKAYMRQNNWDCFIRDDWRALPNLTLLAGLRYDYFSPYAEKDDRLSTLDYNAGFTRVAPVRPNEIGRVSGVKYPRTLVSPDRDNFTPHLGFAWQASRSTVVRSAYGINYTVGLYGSFTQDLAYQPPFAHVEVNLNLPPDLTLFPLRGGFGNMADHGNYSISRNYLLPYTQVWYLEVQQALPHDIVLNVGYSGSKGTRLDVISAPGFYNNVPFASAFFNFEDSTAFSNFNALIVRANKRLLRGLALQATYAYSHSIYDASSINAGTPVVAQNWQDLRAEEGNSSFDIRHQVTGSFYYQLPFGRNSAYVSNGGWASSLLAGWTVAGYFLCATGVPLNPLIAASATEVERGTHGSVRPNRVPGVSIREGGGHLHHWFNTAAFSTNFAPGQLYGTAARNSISGPGVDNLNLSLSRIIALHEGKTLELRITANNALNAVQYAGVNTQFDSTSNGQVDAFQPMRQITFLARFQF
jgi:trimeric autotransporter adhesin